MKLSQAIANSKIVMPTLMHTQLWGGLHRRISEASSQNCCNAHACLIIHFCFKSRHILLSHVLRSMSLSLTVMGTFASCCGRANMFRHVVHIRRCQICSPGFANISHCLFIFSGMEVAGRLTGCRGYICSRVCPPPPEYALIFLGCVPGPTPPVEVGGGGLGRWGPEQTSMSFRENKSIRGSRQGLKV
jgi:hypothetical protein